MTKQDILARLSKVDKEVLIDFAQQIIQKHPEDTVERTLNRMDEATNVKAWNRIVLKCEKLTNEYWAMPSQKRKSKVGKAKIVAIAKIQNNIEKHPIYLKQQKKNNASK